MSTDTTRQTGRVLISGASFAGMSTAIWMRRLGYEVTIIEQAPALRRGGTPVDLHRDAMEIFERMNILPAVRSKALPPRTTVIADLDGTPIMGAAPDASDDNIVIDEYEIHRFDDVEVHRDDLLDVLFAEIQDTVDVIFGDSITELTETAGGVRAAFRNAPDREFVMVFGCDGNHSTVRRLWFGPEQNYSHFLRHYTSVTIVPEMFIEPWTSRIQNAPGRTLLLNSYQDTTDVVFLFQSDEEIRYDYHDIEAQKQIIREKFADAGKPFSDVFEQALNADNFYFDKLSQNRLPAWSSGRVALVGDAAYCPSPAAGMGGSVAILGATALYDAFDTANGDIGAAFAEYDRSFRPTVEKIQDQTEKVGLPMISPDTDEEIAARNAQLLQM